MPYDRFTAPLSRRRFLSLGGKGLAASFLGAALWPLSRAYAADLDIRLIRQIVAVDNRRRRTVMWQSTAKQRHAVAEWRIVGSAKPCIVPAVSEPFADDGRVTFQHTAYLSDLPTGVPIEYRIREEGGPATSWQRLSLDDGTRCRAVIMPDSQCSDGYITYRQVAAAAAHHHPRADLWIQMGDLVDNGEDSTQWDDWFAAMEHIAAQTALVPVLGNHETYDRNWKIRWPKAFLHYFSGVPNNGSRRFPGTYFSFDYGPVHFIVLNTQWEELEPMRPGLFAEQRDWLRRDALASRKPWKIVLMHKDIIEADLPPQNELSDTGSRLMPLFDKLKIDVVLTGHNHTYRRRAPIRNFRRSRQGALYICTGVAGNVRYYDIPRSVYDDVLAPQPETNNYLTLEASPDALTFRCFLPEGRLIDEITQRK